MRRNGNAFGSMEPLIGSASAIPPPGPAPAPASRARITSDINILPRHPRSAPRPARLTRRGDATLAASVTGGGLDESRRREDDWFLKNERQLLDAARVAREKREKERAAKEKVEERAELKALHFMKCPKCGHDLIEENLQGVTVDRCSFCEGV